MRVSAEARRAYLGAFDAWLREPSVATATARQRRFAAICGEAGIDARHAGERSENEQEVGVMESHTPRTARVVMSEALAELRQREARLQRLVGELAEVREAIKAIEKLLPKLSAGGDTGTPSRPTAAAPVLAEAPQAYGSAEERDAAVLQVVAERGPVSSGSIALVTRLPSAVVRDCLTRMRTDGRVIKSGETSAARYTLPVAEAEPLVA